MTLAQWQSESEYREPAYHTGYHGTTPNGAKIILYHGMTVRGRDDGSRLWIDLWNLSDFRVETNAGIMVRLAPITR